jgi:HEAT repeat protein
MTAERSMRPLLLFCIFFLITSVVATVAPVHAQTANPVIVSLNNISDAVRHSKDTGASAEATGRLGQAIDQASIEQLRESVPTILQSVEDPDPTIRSVALIAVVSFNQRLMVESLRTGETLRLLNPYIPAIAAHLTDPDQSVRKTAVLALGSFGSPISDAFPAMIAYLKRDDATTTIGSAIVFELAARGSQRPDVEDAIIAYLNRHDQTTSELKDSIQAIAVQNAQSQRLALAILPFVDASDPTLSASTIRNLPRLTLPEPSFLTAKAHLQAIAADSTQPKIVRNAAAEILPCWINDRHKPCPQSTSSPPLPRP